MPPLKEKMSESSSRIDDVHSIIKTTTKENELNSTNNTNNTSSMSHMNDNDHDHTHTHAHTSSQTKNTPIDHGIPPSSNIDTDTMPNTNPTVTRGRNKTPRLRRRVRSRSAPAAGYNRKKKNNRDYLVEQHFKIDKENRALLPGVPVHDDDLARDIHDFFNLIVLVPIVVLNVLNWNWDMLIYGSGDGNGHGKSMNSHQYQYQYHHVSSVSNMNYVDAQDVPFANAWTGEYFNLFFWTTVAYFLTDLIWVCVFPKCVKSPSTIIQHHIAVFLYLIVPYSIPKVRFLFGVCMSVELNTWFLIARRVFNKQGFPPWKFDIPYFVSVRIKLISIFFYITWISIRCIMYPYVLYVLVFPMLSSKKYGAPDVRNAIYVAIVLQTVFCCLNGQWSLQLLNSKIRQWKSKSKTKIEAGL
jgi:hypothetical protein